MDLLLRFVPLWPAVLPLLLAALVPLPRREAGVGLLALAGLLLAAIPLMPWPDLPRQTPLLGGGGADLTAALRWSTGTERDPARAAFALIMLVLSALGMWTVARLHHDPRGLEPPPYLHERWSFRAAFVALFVVVAGGQLTVLAVTPAAVALGIGVSAAGMLLVDLVCAAPGDRRPLVGALPLLLGPLFLAMSANDPTRGRWLSLIGLTLLVVAVPLRVATAGSPLVLSGPAHALGVSPVALWLLLGAADRTPSLPPFLTLLGLVMFLLAAANAMAARTLRGLLAGQWLAQIGFVVLGGAVASEEGRAALLIALVVNAVGTMLILSLMAARLSRLAGEDRIEMLSELAAPPRRFGLAYALGAASAAGLPLTLGYTLRRTLSGSSDPIIPPLLVAGSTLLLVALVPPLAALLRPSRAGPVGVEADQRVGAGLFIGLLLVLGSAYQAWATLTRRLLSVGIGDTTLASLVVRDAVPEIVGALIELGIVLILLGVANRALRRASSSEPWARLVTAVTQPGWALPWSALRRSIWLLTPEPWLAQWTALRGGDTLPRAPAEHGVGMRAGHARVLVILAALAIVMMMVGASAV